MDALPDWVIWVASAVIFSAVAFGIVEHMLGVREDETCSNCKKSKAGKTIRKGEAPDYHRSYRCKFCQHEWTGTVKRDEPSDREDWPW